MVASGHRDDTIRATGIAATLNDDGTQSYDPTADIGASGGGIMNGKFSVPGLRA